MSKSKQNHILFSSCIVYMISKTGLKLQSKLGEEKMGSEKVDAMSADNPWEKFYSKEKINGMGAGRIHQ